MYIVNSKREIEHTTYSKPTGPEASEWTRILKNILWKTLLYQYFNAVKCSRPPKDQQKNHPIKIYPSIIS